MNKLDRGHLTEDQMLRFADGELSTAEARQVRAHLNSCWECRAELDALQKTIGECVRYRKTVLQTHLPPPPRPWADLRNQFDQVDSARAGQNLLRRAFTAFEPLWTNPRRWLPAAAALLLVVGLVQHFRQTPSVKAAELLRKAVTAAETRPAPQRIIQIRTSKGKITRRIPVQRVNGNDELRPVIDLFEEARYDWQDPLSARSYLAWHQQLAAKEDSVDTVADPESPARNLYHVRTLASSGVLEEARLALRVDDLKPVESVLRFRNREWVQITELPVEPPAATAALDTARSPAVAAPEPEPELATASDELQVIAALHRLGADLGDPIDVRRSGTEVAVTSQGMAPERRREIESALSALPNVTLRLSDAPSMPAAAPQTGTESAVPQRSDLLAGLETFAGGRAQLDRFAAEVLDDTDQMMSRAYALRNLAERFGPEIESTLGREERQLLAGIVGGHIASLRSRVAAIERQMTPGLVSLGAPPAAPAPAALPSRWQAATEVLFGKARRVEKSLGSVLAGAPAEFTGELTPAQVLGWIAELRAASEGYEHLVNP